MNREPSAAPRKQTERAKNKAALLRVLDVAVLKCSPGDTVVFRFRGLAALASAQPGTVDEIGLKLIGDRLPPHVKYLLLDADDSLPVVISGSK